MGIKATQKRIGVDKWHRLLGELLSMDLDLPSAQGLFSHMQEALHHVDGKRFTLTRGFHYDFADFLWLA